MSHEKSPLDLIDFCQKYMNLFLEEIEGKDIPITENVYIISTLWMRIIEIHKGVIVLANTGLGTNSFILQRTMSETFILLEKCIHDSTFTSTFLNKMYKEKIKRLKSISESLEHIKYDLSQEEISELKEKFVNLIPKDQSSDYRIKNLFYDQNFISIYETIYCYCTLFTHSEATILDRYLVEGNKNHPPQLVQNKSVYLDTIVTCIMSATLFNFAFISYSKFINHESKHLENFKLEFKKIQELYKLS